MANRPAVSIGKLSPRSRFLLIIGGIILLVLLLGSRLINTYVDYLWFREVDATGVFATTLWTRIALFVVVGVVVGGAVALALTIAYRTRPVFVPVVSDDDPLARYRSTVMGRIRWFAIGIPVFIGFIAGMTAQSDWKIVQLFFHGGDFGRTDPEFGLDIGFYVFRLPFYNWVLTWIFVSIGLCFVAAAICHYLFGGIRLAGRHGQLTSAARIQLAITAGLFVLFKGFEYFLDRYNVLLDGRNDLFTGASYTDLHTLLPAKLILTSIAIFCAGAFFVGAFLKNLMLPAIALVLMIVSSILIGSAWPMLFERFSVAPNAIGKEKVPIERNMAETKYAYGLDPQHVTYKDYGGSAEVTKSDVENDKATMPNVRLLDPSVLNRTFTQQQQRKNFYGFPQQLDIDRYTINGKTQDYVVALREIKTDQLSENQQNWISQHLVFTHGNGFIAAPANTVRDASKGGNGQGGYPDYVVSDTQHQGAIKVKQPRVYYGELMTNYAIVGTDRGEYDADGKNGTSTYTGKGGVPLDNVFDRFVFAVNNGEWKILLSNDINDKSKIIYNRDPAQRVQKKAPWLTLDGDPYPAVVNGRIKWIVDGYTTTQNVPYAQKTRLGDAIASTRTGQVRNADDQISYIRNSVKATVDAYDGSVDLYATDESDPVLKAWEGVFPGTVKPKSSIPKALAAHFRYPEDLFKVQRELLAKYHVNDPGTFYTGENRWSIPSDPTIQGPGGGANQPPYYILAADPRNPNSPTSQFQLTSVLTPFRRQFMSAFVSVSSDPSSYGKITVRQLPSTTQTSGPQQVQNDFLSSASVSKQINLLTQQNTRVIYGNLLTLPVKDGLIYVEPVYVERTGEESSFPQLNNVLVFHAGKVGFAPTLSKALEQVLGKGAGKSVGDHSKSDTTPTPSKDKPKVTPSDGKQTTQTPAAQKAADDMDAAAKKLFEARQSGDFTGEAKALQELQKASDAYQKATG